MDHCQLSGSVGHYIQERKDQIRPQYPQTTIPPTVHNNEDDSNNSADKVNENAGGGGEQADGSLYDDIIQDGDEMTSIGGHFLGVEKSVPKAQAQTSNRLPAPVVEIPNEKLHTDETTDPSSRPFLVSSRQLFFFLHSPLLLLLLLLLSSREGGRETKPVFTLVFQDPARVTRYESDRDKFPHGPRNLEGDTIPSATPLSSPNGRRKRSVVVSDRKIRSADVGVSGLYEVISEADLAFSPDTHAEAVTVFQGRIREEVVYGICLPMPGFSALFIVVALSAVVSALVAGAMLHRLQAQREAADSRKNNGAVHSTNGWLPYGLLRVRCAARPAHPEQIQQKQTNPVAATTSPPVERGG